MMRSNAIPTINLCVLACVLSLVSGAARVNAQEQPPGQGGGRGGAQNAPGGRAGRGASTREFLGLGRAPDPAASARGEILYGPNCGFCHGVDARGGAQGPNLIRSELVLHDDKGELIGPVLLKGRPEKGMNPFPGLTPEQIFDISEFLHMKIEMAANRGLYGSIYRTLSIVTGEAKAGEAFFNGAGGCKNCHSIGGDLSHIASRYDPMNLQNRWLWPGGGGRGGRRGGEENKATITLPSGEKIIGTVKRMDDFDISIYDSDGNYRAWSRDQVKVEIPDPLAAHRMLLDRVTDADIHNLTAYLVTLK